MGYTVASNKYAAFVVALSIVLIIMIVLIVSTKSVESSDTGVNQAGFLDEPPEQEATQTDRRSRQALPCGLRNGKAVSACEALPCGLRNGFAVSACEALRDPESSTGFRMAYKDVLGSSSEPDYDLAYKSMGMEYMRDSEKLPGVGGYDDRLPEDWTGHSPDAKPFNSQDNRPSDGIIHMYTSHVPDHLELVG